MNAEATEVKYEDVKNTFHHGEHCLKHVSGAQLVSSSVTSACTILGVKPLWVTGAVLETIMAKMDGVQGDRISAGGHTLCQTLYTAMAYMRPLRIFSVSMNVCS